MAAVLAIFKAGGVYLPIEPHFPADRIAPPWIAAGCDPRRHRSTAAVDARSRRCDVARRGPHPVPSTTSTERVTPTSDLGVDVGEPISSPTSTSPPVPPVSRRARCASTRACSTTSTPRSTTLEIGDGTDGGPGRPTVLRHLALAAGVGAAGRWAHPDDRSGDDPARAPTVPRHRGRRTGRRCCRWCRRTSRCCCRTWSSTRASSTDLHCVSVTGEAVTLELIQRWFAAEPEIKLANAYGLTETSDDTNHEVMTRAPDRGRCAARAGRQQRPRLVVDEHLAPVPLGAPGEIVFSGVCVGRGLHQRSRSHPTGVRARSPS